MNELVKLGGRPREQSGRDSFARYRAQVRAAAIASLAILGSGEIDRVYCDLYDDYVVRRNQNGKYQYTFVQVKTRGKQNSNWTLGELLGINTRAKKISSKTAAQIKDSFLGKLLVHTAIFGVNCERVVFQTNVNLDDNIVNFSENISSKLFSDKYVSLVIDHYNECFKGELKAALLVGDIKICLEKLVFETDVSYLKDPCPEFDSKARKTVYDYSEIDLRPLELDQILLKLLDCVEKKSSGVIKDISEESIDKLASIGIDDLLEVMAISKEAYALLNSGSDAKAVKSASLIQRALGDAAQDTDTLHYCSTAKMQWDLWQRRSRHYLTPMQRAYVLDPINLIIDTHVDWQGKMKLSSIQLPLQNLLGTLHADVSFIEVGEIELLGAFFSELIKRKI